MTVYSTNFATASPPSGFTTLYTVATGFVVVVRDMELLNTGGLTETFSVFANTPGGSATFWQIAASSLTWYQWAGRVVLPAGSSIQCSVPSGGSMQIMVSGYLLTT